MRAALFCTSCRRFKRTLGSPYRIALRSSKLVITKAWIIASVDSRSKYVLTFLILVKWKWNVLHIFLMRSSITALWSGVTPRLRTEEGGWIVSPPTRTNLILLRLMIINSKINYFTDKRNDVPVAAITNFSHDFDSLTRSEIEIISDFFLDRLLP